MDDARERAEALLGQAEDEVEEGDEVRIVRRGDEVMNVTMDLRPGRLNVELDDAGDGTFEVVTVVMETEEGAEVFGEPPAGPVA